jgi:hypothetical protein
MNLFDTEANFQISFNDKIVRIEKMEMGKNTLYVARFPNADTLLVTRAKDANGAGFWTSIPEGRQKLAEAIGELITDHIRKSL